MKNKKLIIIIIVSVVLVLTGATLFIINKDIILGNDAKNNKNEVADDNNYADNDYDDDNYVDNDSKEDNNSSKKGIKICNSNGIFDCKSYIEAMVWHNTYDKNVYETPKQYIELSKIIPKLDTFIFEKLAYEYNEYNSWYSNSVLLSSDIDDATKVRLAMIRYLYDNKDNIDSLYVGYKIPKDEIIKTINNMFDGNVEYAYVHDEIPLHFKYEYSENEKSFIITKDLEYGGFGGPGDDLIRKEVKYEKTSNGINVYIRFMTALLSNVDGGTISWDIYSDCLFDTFNTAGQNPGNYAPPQYDKRYIKTEDWSNFNDNDKLKQYKFEFINKNGNYLLKSVQKMN